MSVTAVLLELKDASTLRQASLHAIAYARQLSSQTGTSLSLILLGHRVESVLDQVLGLGASHVYAIDDAIFSDPVAERQVPSLKFIVDKIDATYVVAAATSMGKDVLPRLAQSLGAAYVADCIGHVLQAGNLLWQRPVCAGNAIAFCQSNTPRTVVSVRYSHFDSAKPNGSVSKVSLLNVAPVERSADKLEVLGYDWVANARPELSEARVVVSGGRALSSQFFEVLDPLADALGAALGATRAACDGGFAPSDFQVGQTGKVVSPDLYIAVGISGALQHLAGMRGANTIVAINNDPRAPIVSMADYTLVGDLFKLVPELVQALRQRPAS